MRRPKIKAQRKGRKAFKSKTFVTSTVNDNRQSAMRNEKRGNQEYPNSSKVGAKKTYTRIRRRLSQLVVFKRNHRTNETVGYKPDSNKPVRKIQPVSKIN